MTRIAVFALVDATAYPTAGNGTYVLPGVDFYLAFGLLGTWLLAIVARDAGSQAQVTEGNAVEEAAPRAGDRTRDPGPVAHRTGAVAVRCGQEDHEP